MSKEYKPTHKRIFPQTEPDDESSSNNGDTRADYWIVGLIFWLARNWRLSSVAIAILLGWIMYTHSMDTSLALTPILIPGHEGDVPCLEVSKDEIPERFRDHVMRWHHEHWRLARTGGRAEVYRRAREEGVYIFREEFRGELELVLSNQVTTSMAIAQYGPLADAKLYGRVRTSVYLYGWADLGKPTLLQETVDRMMAQNGGWYHGDKFTLRQQTLFVNICRQFEEITFPRSPPKWWEGDWLRR